MNASTHCPGCGVLHASEHVYCQRCRTKAFNDAWQDDDGDEDDAHLQGDFDDFRAEDCMNYECDSFLPIPEN